MSEPQHKKMSTTTIAMLIMVTTFGLSNVIDNLSQMGLAAIPSWFVVGVLYFLPLALILAEFASVTEETGGIYSYMERGLGPTWAFVGTWSYFASNLIYLQSAFSKLPIRISLGVTGHDAFASRAALLPLLGVGLCLAMTFVATRGVRFFSRLSDWVGIGTLVMVALLIVVPLAWLCVPGHDSATPFSAKALTPTFDLDYFSTFSWLLFAVAGAEVAAPYVKNTADPRRNFPRAILLATLLIALIYILASVALVVAMPVGSLTKATGLYDIWLYLAALVGLPGPVVARFFTIFLVTGIITAAVIWIESPVRAMFAEVPVGTFPPRLTQKDAAGTHQQALWIQAVVVSVLILIPLLSILTGLEASEAFIRLLNDLSSLSLVIPYVFLSISYIRARRNGMDAPFKMARSTPVAIGIAVLVLVVSAAGYFGAGLYALQADPIDWIYVGIVYGGPLALILLGIALRATSMRILNRRSAVDTAN